MEIEEAWEFMAKWEAASEAMLLADERRLRKLQPGDRELSDGRALSKKDFVEARSVIARWENSKEPADSGRHKELKLARAEAYA